MFTLKSTISFLNCVLAETGAPKLLVYYIKSTLSHKISGKLTHLKLLISKKSHAIKVGREKNVSQRVQERCYWTKVTV